MALRRKIITLMVLLCAAVFFTAARTHAQTPQTQIPFSLGTLPGGTESQAYAINTNGDVVGQSSTSSGAIHGFVWIPTAAGGSTGSMTDLLPLGGGTASAAYGINDDGTIVGYSDVMAGGEDVIHAVTWTSSGGTPTDLGTWGGDDSVAYGINNNGDIVGSADDTDGNTHAIQWTDGNAIDLGLLTPANSTVTGNYTAYSINDNEIAAGDGETPSGDTHAVLFEQGLQPWDMSVLSSGTYQGTYSSARAINNNDNVAGEGDLVTGSGSPSQDTVLGFFWLDRTAKMYPVTAPQDPSFEQFTPLDAISDNDQMVGQTYNPVAGTSAAAAIVWQNYGAPAIGSATQNMIPDAYTIDQGTADPNSPPPNDPSQWVTHDGAWNLEAATGINFNNTNSEVVGYGTYDGASTAFLLELPFRDGAKPSGPLLQFSNDDLYGTTSAGGANGAGTIFRVNSPSALQPDNSTTVLHNFNIVEGYPIGSLVTDGNNMYGLTSNGLIYALWASTSSSVYIYEVLSGSYPPLTSLMYDIDNPHLFATSGSEILMIDPIYDPLGHGSAAVRETWTLADEGYASGLTAGPDGNVYGIDSLGSIFQFLPAGYAPHPTTMYSFPSGAGPYGSLTADPYTPTDADGYPAFYGADAQGIFKYGGTSPTAGTISQIGGPASEYIATPFCFEPSVASLYTVTDDAAVSAFAFQGNGLLGSGVQLLPFGGGATGGWDAEFGPTCDPSSYNIFGATVYGGNGINAVLDHSNDYGYGTVWGVDDSLDVSSYLVIHFLGG